MKNAAYFIAAEVGVLMIVTYFPILSLWLPRLLGYAD
jgi:TRAP-type C4-dicarboxylate transport system permease large subunit